MRPLVYLHPAGGVRPTKVLEKLKPRQPVFPGFDGTPTVAGLNSRKALGKWVGEYIDREIGGPCDILGCSFGGAVALWLAILRPELVDHLVLECPAGLQTIDAKLRADPAEFRKALFVHPEKAFPVSKTREVEAENRRMLTHYGAEDGKDLELLQTLETIKHRTLILHGTEDRIIGRESVRLLKSRLAKSFLVYVWDAAHNIEVDQPERMLELVEGFLERSEAFVVNRAG
ncbi:MAG TPA: alpha/beta hydrolase [Burkholderiales bacterium]|nr:alpha/beta hydrolase [Burkholderiales bacterium]